MFKGHTIKIGVIALLVLCVLSWGTCGTFFTNPSHDCRSMSSSKTALYTISQCSNTVSGPCAWGSNDPQGTIIANGGGGSFYCTAVQPLAYCCQGNLTISYCDTQAEADCINAGGTWNGSSCQGLEDSTTINLLIDACESISGTPNYRFNNDGNVVGYCDICQTDESGNYTNPHVQEMWNDYKEGCCQTGHAPNKSNFKCLSSQNGCYAADCPWQIDPSVSGGGIGYSETGLTSRTCEISVTTNIDGVVQGCEETPTSSSSTEGSSDSQGSSSSGEGSSASAEENLQNIADGVGAIIDSLHKIIVIDSMNRTYDSLVAVFVSEIATYAQEVSENMGGGGDTTIVNVNVPRDTNIINVDVGQAAVVSAIDDLKSMNLSIGDSTHKLLDSISKFLSTIGDTSGVPQGDTSGWGGWIDSASAWLRDSTFFRSFFGSSQNGAICDTTQGQKCPSAGGSLDSAKDSWHTTYQALGDLLTQGAIGDSLSAWENTMLNNGVITGSGSNSCPSVFSRTFTLTIGSGVSVDVPALGQYVCATIPNTSITFWTLARVLIRAMVAITCMWWLYRAVTGVTYEGGDDD